MINVEYTMQKQETVKATLDFLSNRPFLSIMFFCMKVSCIILCLGFAFSVYTKVARPEDFVAALFAVIWLFYYKAINRWVIGNTLKHRKFDLSAQKYTIDQKSIACMLQSKNPFNIEWKKIKYILQNKDGYIIPLTGFSNAGKFLWFPKRGFQNPNMEQEFIDIVQQLKLRIKPTS